MHSHSWTCLTAAIYATRKWTYHIGPGAGSALVRIYELLADAVPSRDATAVLASKYFLRERHALLDREEMRQKRTPTTLSRDSTCTTRATVSVIIAEHTKELTVYATPHKRHDGARARCHDSSSILVSR